ncbi:MAG: tRNA-dihydrouridine synthase 3, partial [Chaenotheca gracillima]
HLLDVYVEVNRLFAFEEKAREAAKKNKQDTADLESQGLFAERNAFFKAMEEREPAAIALWKRFRDVSIIRYIETYARLNIHFDEYSGESQIDQKSIKRVEKLLAERGISEEDNGSTILNFKKHGAPKLDVAILRNRTGTSTYILRDLAAVLERSEKFNFDKMIYVVSTEQDAYLRQVFKAVELMGDQDLAKKLQHVSFGRVEGMSTRLGNVRLLSDILDECGRSMHDVMRANEDKYAQVENPEAIADTLRISAVM